jgi:benzoyl-CoA reductase subunit D
MITAGVDLGGKAIKVVVLAEGRIVSRLAVASSHDRQQTAVDALAEAAKRAEISPEQIECITSTGTGSRRAAFAAEKLSVVGADARAAAWLFPGAGVVIDVGAEEARVAKYTADGRAVDFVTNEKCAAGAGTFIEAVARALDVKLEELGSLSLRCESAIPINGQCAVFAESEVVSLIHSGAAREDIAGAVYDAVANRIASMALRVGLGEEVVLGGGVAHDAGFVHALEKSLEVSLRIPEEPVYLGALGAALDAAGGNGAGEAAP